MHAEKRIAPLSQRNRSKLNGNKTTAQIAALHLLCWWVFLSLPALFNPRIANLGLVNIIRDLGEPPRIANGLIFIAIFYFNYYIAIPYLYFRERYLAFLFYLIATFLLFFLANYLMMPPDFAMEHHGGVNVLGPSFNLFMYLITMIVSFALSIYGQWRRTNDEQLNNEISFLKAQINPHFLFNTLNSIYSLALIKSDDAPEAVLKLSGMMRYAVSETDKMYVSLEKELNYITDYIELQKLRLASNVGMTYNFTGNWLGKQIAPFILVPFIENAFKYGVNAEENSDIVVNINVMDRSLEMNVFNKKVYVEKNSDNNVGLGIGNTRKRLQMLYPGKHILTIFDEEKDFSVTLKIDLL